MAGVDLGSVFAKLEMQTKNFEDGINKSTKKLDGFSKKVGKTMKNIGKVMAKGMAVGGVALAGAGIASVKMAADFEKSMTNIRTLIDDNVENFGEMKNAVLELSKRVPVAIGDLSSALYDVRSAGISAEDAMNVLESSAILATAGLSTTQEATNLLTSAINVYGDETHDAAKLSDILFKTVKYGKTTVAELSQGFGKVAAIAKETGISIEDLSAATAILTTGGITASEAQTALKAAIANVLKPTKDATVAAKELGIRFDLGALQAKGLSGMMMEIAEKAGDDKQALADLFGSVEAANAIFALTAEKGGADMVKIIEDMTVGENALMTAFEKQTETTWAQYEMFKNNLNVVLIKLGSKILPYVNKAMKLLIERGGALKDKIIALKNKILDWVAGIKKSIEENEALQVIMDMLKDKIIALKNKILDWVAGIKKSIEENEALQKVLGFLKDMANALWLTLGDLKKEWDEILKTLKPLLPALKLIAIAIGVVLVGAVSLVIVIFASMATAIAGAIKGVVKVVESIGQVISGMIGFVMSIIKGDWEMAWKYFLDIPKGIIGIFQGVIGTITGFFKGIFDGAVRFFKNLYKVLLGRSIIPDIVNGIIRWFRKLPSSIWNAIKNVGYYIGRAFSGLKNIGKNAVWWIVNAFFSLPGKIWNAIKSVGFYIKRAFKNIKIPMPHFSLGTQYKKFLGVSVPMPKFNIKWYEKGTPWVPETGLAMLHKGEAVIPANQNKGGAGGIVVNVNGGNYFGSKEEVGDMIAKVIGKRFDFNNRF